MFLTGMFAAEDAASYHEMSDESLLVLSADGDKEAFRQLYQNTEKSIYSFILSIVKNPADAEELMQDTYMKVWDSAGNYCPQGKPLAWMFTIARNLCYMKFREQKREADLGPEEAAELKPAEYCPQIEEAADKLVLDAALQLLKEEERKIVLLRTSAGMKHREIAAALDLPLATVLSKYNRAMKKLKDYLKEEETH